MQEDLVTNIDTYPLCNRVDAGEQKYKILQD